MKVIALLVLACAVAHADPRADKLFKVGQDRYNVGDFDGAAKNFILAYQIDGDPAYLFNIAQAYRQAKQCAKAASYYRQFVAAVPKPPNPDKLQRLIGEMDACARTQLQATPPPPPPPEPTKPVAAPPAPSVAPVVPVEPAPLVDAPTDPNRTRRWIGIGVGAAGVVAVATGIGFGIAARSARRDHDAVCPSPCTMWEPGYNDQRAALDATGRRDQTIEIVTLSAGAVAIAAGVALYVTGRSSETVAVAPTPGGAMVSLGLPF